MLRAATRRTCSQRGRKNQAEFLMLGVGGGTAIHQLNKLIEPKQIVGIEINPVHLQVAREYFGLNADNIQLVEADAFSWVDKNQRKFDVIVDDLFVDAPDDPVRPFEPNRSWLKKLGSRLTRQGLLIQNHLSMKSAKRVIGMAESFSTALLFTTPRYQNVIVALYRETVDVKSAVDQMKQIIREIDPKALDKLKFSVKRATLPASSRTYPGHPCSEGPRS
jgi:spermidine synthase